MTHKERTAFHALLFTFLVVAASTLMRSIGLIQDETKLIASLALFLAILERLRSPRA